MDGYELRVGPFVVSTDPTRLDLPRIHRFLAEDSYWARGIPSDVVRRAIAGSLCFGVYEGEAMVGFGRAVTDGATFAWVSDVFVEPAHRRRGVSKALMQAMIGHPSLQGLRRWLLATADAHRLYERFGFRPLASPDRFMERWDPDVYASGAAHDDHR